MNGLLNALCGIGAPEGRILFVATNQFKSLDPALRRPERIDYVLEFKLASRYQVGELFRKLYLDNPHMSTSKDSARFGDESGDSRSSDSDIGVPVEPEAGKVVDFKSPKDEVQDQARSVIIHRTECDVEHVSPEQLDALVERFREAIPEREFSMAAVQQYLLMYRTQPRRAVECVGKWVEDEMAKRKWD